ncbi:MAG: hypothetical protein ABJM86_01965 [Hyphomicrobiales bacterium]
MQEKYLSNLEKTLDRSVSITIAFLEAANSFSLLAVRSLIFINSGALFIFPVFLQQLLTTKNEAVPLLEFAIPAICFVLGLLFSLACALVTYYNFQKNAENQKNRFVIDENNLAQRHGMLDRSVSPEFFDVIKNRIEKAKAQNSILMTKIKRLNVFAYVFGIGSLSFFTLGCLSFANAILQLKVI